MKTDLNQEPKASFQAKKPIRHTRQVIWQVRLPIVVTILLVLAAAVLIIVLPAEGRTSINQFASISTILVILPVLGFVIMLLGIVAGLIYVTSLVMKQVPVIGSKTQLISENLTHIAKTAADGIAKPLVWINSGFASLNRIFELLTGKRK